MLSDISHYCRHKLSLLKSTKVIYLIILLYIVHLLLLPEKYKIKVFPTNLNLTGLPGLGILQKIAPVENKTTEIITFRNSTIIIKYESSFKRDRNESQKIIDSFNEIGSQPLFTQFDVFEKSLRKREVEEKVTKTILDHMHKVYQPIENRLKKTSAATNYIIHNNVEMLSKERKATRINLGTIACGQRNDEVMTMLKSAALFSQDAALHVIMFVDDDSVIHATQDLLELKWTVNFLGWDLTFEVHLDWFPVDQEHWKDMYRKCATQRLFFPSILHHIDSLIYLDSDILIVSNLTEFWLEFQKKVTADKLAALAANNEPTTDGWYVWQKEKKIPFYGPRGLNAGVMLMNLTKMRSFNFQQKAIAAHLVYKEKIQLADQDIINIIFAGYPERVGVLDCTYNFNWVYCGSDVYECYHPNGTNKCICPPVVKNGVQIIHGNTGTFHSTFFRHIFLKHVYEAFVKLNLLADSYISLFENLRRQFDNLEKRPCDPLTSDHLYRNAETYLKILNT